MEDAVAAFASLPGIGKKSALRLALHLLDRDVADVSRFSDALVTMRRLIKYCNNCHNLSDEELCSICKNPRRDHSLVCVVEGVRDVMAIEETGQFQGVYHLLGGVISPLEGIGPAELHIDSLVSRVQKGEILELIMAISPTIEGETTIFYLSKQLAAFPVKISTIARGVAFGGELEYADEITLGRSILARTPYHLPTQD